MTKSICSSVHLCQNLINGFCTNSHWLVLDSRLVSAHTPPYPASPRLSASLGAICQGKRVVRKQWKRDGSERDARPPRALPLSPLLESHHADQEHSLLRALRVITHCQNEIAVDFCVTRAVGAWRGNRCEWKLHFKGVLDLERAVPESEGSDEENVTEFGEKWQIFRLQADECLAPRDNLWHSLPTLLGIYIVELYKNLSSLHASISLFALLA